MSLAWTLIAVNSISVQTLYKERAGIAGIAG